MSLIFMPYDSSKPDYSNPKSPFDLPIFTPISVIAAVWAGLAAGVFLVRGAFRIIYPYLTNLGEPALAQTIRYVQMGIWPYHDLTSPPFSVVPYGPVYLGISGCVQVLFGPDLPMAGGRTVCLAASVVSAICIGRLMIRGDRRAHTHIAAVGAGCFLLSLPYIDRWGAQVNVDMTAVAIELVALCGFFFYIIGDYRVKKYFWIGTAAAVLAVFTKSSAIAATLAWGTYLILARRWKDLAIFCLAAGSAVLGIYGLLNYLTDGQYYFHTTHEIGHRLFFTRFILDYWRDICLTQPVNVVAAVLAFLSPVLWFGLDGRQGLLNLYLVFTVLLTISLGKQGSDTNYLLPFIAASTLAAGRLWGWYSRGWKQILGMVMAVAIAAQAVVTGGVLSFSIKNVREGRVEQKKFYDRVSAMMERFRDPIISWDMALLIANGRPIYFEPFPMAQAAYSGVWDQTPILNDLRSRKIQLIVTYFWYRAIKADRNFTPEFIAALRENYLMAGQIKIPWAENQYLFFYTPKKS